MPHKFRTSDGRVWEPKPNETIPLTLADGTSVEGVWAGSAKHETLEEIWLSKPGNQLAQSEEIAAIAVKDDETKETVWGEAPAGARLFFVLLAREVGKNYRLAKMVTTAATPAQKAHFHHPRFSFFGRFRPDGSIQSITPLPPPPPRVPAQGELF